MPADRPDNDGHTIESPGAGASRDDDRPTWESHGTVQRHPVALDPDDSTAPRWIMGSESQLIDPASSSPAIGKQKAPLADGSAPSRPAAARSAATSPYPDFSSIRPVVVASAPDSIRPAEVAPADTIRSAAVAPANNWSSPEPTDRIDMSVAGPPERQLGPEPSDASGPDSSDAQPYPGTPPYYKRQPGYTASLQAYPDHTSGSFHQTQPDPFAPQQYSAPEISGPYSTYGPAAGLQPVSGGYAPAADWSGANSSGLDDAVPFEVYSAGWNWGAFIAAPAWAAFHGLATWSLGVVSLAVVGWILAGLLVHPYDNVTRCLTVIACGILATYLGLNGYRLAWRHRQFESIDHLFAVQRSWNTMSLAVCLPLWLAIGLFSVYLGVTGGGPASVVASRHAPLPAPPPPTADNGPNWQSDQGQAPPPVSGNPSNQSNPVSIGYTGEKPAPPPVPYGQPMIGQPVAEQPAQPTQQPAATPPGNPNVATTYGRPNPNYPGNQAVAGQNGAPAAQPGAGDAGQAQPAYGSPAPSDGSGNPGAGSGPYPSGQNQPAPPSNQGPDGGPAAGQQQNPYAGQN